MSKQEKNNKLFLLYNMVVRDFNELQIMTDIHPRTLYRNLTKLREGQTLEHRPGSGCPKTLRPFGVIIRGPSLSWLEITQSFQRKNSIPRRLQLCIANRGGIISY